MLSQGQVESIYDMRKFFHTSDNEEKALSNLPLNSL